MTEDRKQDRGTKLDLVGDASHRCEKRDRFEVFSCKTVVDPERVKPYLLGFGRESSDEVRRDLSGGLNKTDADVGHAITALFGTGVTGLAHAHVCHSLGGKAKQPQSVVSQNSFFGVSRKVFPRLDRADCGTIAGHIGVRVIAADHPTLISVVVHERG